MRIFEGTTITLATLTFTVLAQPVHADDAAPPPAPAVTTTESPNKEVATTTPAADPVAVTVTGPAEEPAPRYPRAVIARPLTLPKGLAMLGADVGANHDFSAVGGTPIVGYGITDDLEVQVPYAFAAKDFDAKGALEIDAGYKLLRGAAGGKLEVIARVRGGYSLLTESATPLRIGVHAQYNLTDKIALISGTPGAQQLRISLAEDTATMSTPIDLSLPIAVGFQATPELYLQLDTKLVQLDLSESANALVGKDATPVLLTAIYNVLPALDVQAAIGTDLTNTPGDALTFLVGARYYAGKL